MLLKVHAQALVEKTVFNGMTFDGATTDPMQLAVRDALIAFMAATAGRKGESTKAAQRPVSSTSRPRANAATGGHCRWQPCEQQ
jgi:hypothetical protein